MITVIVEDALSTRIASLFTSSTVTDACTAFSDASHEPEEAPRALRPAAHAWRMQAL